MVDTEIEKGSFEIEGISDHRIEETPITLEYPFYEPFGCNDLAFPRPDQLHI
jgi:hypothetical protein